MSRPPRNPRAGCPPGWRHDGADTPLIHGREYSRNREDYRELCPRCHRTYDHGGERSPNAKLTDAIVLDMRRRHAAGEITPALAREYGVCQATAWRAATGKSWRHLP